MEIAQLTGGNRRGRLRHQIRAFGGFWEGDDIANARCPAQNCIEPIKSEGDATVRRRPITKRLEHVTEAELGFLRRDLQHFLKNRSLQVRLMNTDGAAAEFDAVDDDVV